MYNAGATFCLQQNFLCARFVYEILKQEFKKSKNGDDAIVPFRCADQPVHPCVSVVKRDISVILQLYGHAVFV